MTHARTIALAVGLCSIAGCGGGQVDDAGADAAMDARSDTSTGDGAADSARADTGPGDTATADTASDDATGDTGAEDGAADASTTDTGAIDTGAIDTGAIDTGAIDTGAIDTGAIDTGAIDTGATDTGRVDTGTAPCTPACGSARVCCSGECTNPENDPRNCGTCGLTCRPGTYCTGGSCEPIPCTGTCGGGALCCGSACCGAGQICCDPQGPVVIGPTCTTPDSRGTCPVGCAPLCACAAPDTPIATPSGEVPIAELAVGDLVLSEEDGAIVVVPIVAVRRVPVQSHAVMEVALESGVTLHVSPRHPTADGRTFADLAAGAELDGVRVERATLVPYAHAYTHDILPGSSSGTYFAGGARIGTTITEALVPGLAASNR